MTARPTKPPRTTPFPKRMSRSAAPRSQVVISTPALEGPKALRPRRAAAALRPGVEDRVERRVGRLSRFPSNRRLERVARDVSLRTEVVSLAAARRADGHGQRHEQRLVRRGKRVEDLRDVLLEYRVRRAERRERQLRALAAGLDKALVPRGRAEFCKSEAVHRDKRRHQTAEEPGHDGGVFYGFADRRHAAHRLSARFSTPRLQPRTSCALQRSAMRVTSIDGAWQASQHTRRDRRPSSRAARQQKLSRERPSFAPLWCRARNNRAVRSTRAD